MTATTTEKRPAFRALHADGHLRDAQPVGPRLGALSAALGSRRWRRPAPAWRSRPAARTAACRVDDVLAHLGLMAAAASCRSTPISRTASPNARGGRGQRGARRATGIAGLSIEDFTGDAGRPLYDPALAVERMRAARAALDAAAADVVLTARAEAFLHGQPDPLRDVGAPAGLRGGRRRRALCARAARRRTRSPPSSRPWRRSPSTFSRRAGAFRAAAGRPRRAPRQRGRRPRPRGLGWARARRPRDRRARDLRGPARQCAGGFRRGVRRFDP